MKDIYSEVTYRHGRPIAAYYYLPRDTGDKSARTRRVEPGLIIDFTADDQAIGLRARCRSPRWMPFSENSGIVLAALLMVLGMTQGGSSQLVQVVREPIKFGDETAYEAIEQDTARACAELKCPHPHLALEPVSGPREVWWLNLFSSDADRRRVIDDYARNAPLMAVLERNSKRKAAVTGPLVDLLFTYRPDLSRGAQLELAGARFLAVTINPGVVMPDGAVFEAGDGTRVLLRSARTRQDAERLASVGRAQTTVLAIRPSWGMPATDWIEADPNFWAANPILRR